MVTYSSKFEIPNENLEQIKQRVKAWLSSFSHPDYALEVISERHVKISRVKHDLKICVYGCITMFVMAFAGAFVLIGAFYASRDISVVFIYLFLVMMTEPLFIGWFCLYPNKIQFEVTFSNEYPIKVYVIASGNLLEAYQQEYYSFLKALNPSQGSGGIDLA
ncbi:MAG: hypothetical protein ACFFD3_17145 [Candidatus Thorarchaeota archaeon]